MKVGDLVTYITRHGETWLGVILDFDLEVEAVLVHTQAQNIWFGTRQVNPA